MKKATLPAGARVKGHSLAFAILRKCGVNPAAALAGSAMWPDCYAPDYIENDHGVLRMRMPLNKSRQVMVAINGDDVCISARDQAFPETALLALPGMPIVQVLDHVLFTGEEHRVRSAEAFVRDEDGSGTHFFLEGDEMEYVAP
ncbi:hypothetical protein [Sphingomonas sp. 3-13AW]|uniref:hypothetical protein n=1 Tax=Sphingomonas sp. 3-13AW TaxID=3050450 RepID=UPI003BB75F83